MMSMFGGYVSVADCPISTSPFVYSSLNPYDVYGGSEFDSIYNDPGPTGLHLLNAMPGPDVAFGAPRLHLQLSWRCLQGQPEELDAGQR